MGLPAGFEPLFLSERESPDLWHCRVQSLWSLSPGTNCSASSGTLGSWRLRQEEEEEGGQRRKAGERPGGSEGVKEVSLT